MEQLNNFDPNLKFTHERLREEINFLDVTIRVNHCEFITCLYCKSNDDHLCLYFHSCHPGHSKSSIVVQRRVTLLLMLESLTSLWSHLVIAKVCPVEERRAGRRRCTVLAVLLVSTIFTEYIYSCSFGIYYYYYI